MKLMTELTLLTLFAARDQKRIKIQNDRNGNTRGDRSGALYGRRRFQCIFDSGFVAKEHGGGKKDGLNKTRKA